MNACGERVEAVKNCTPADDSRKGLLFPINCSFTRTYREPLIPFIVSYIGNQPLHIKYI